MRILMVMAVLLLVLFASLIGGATGVAAQEPDKIKVTLSTDDITANEDGVYRVTWAAVGSDGSASPSMPAPLVESFNLSKGDSILFSREMAFTTSEFIWELTVTPPARSGLQTRLLILSGVFPPPNISEFISLNPQASPKLLSSPYLQSQPPSHGIDIGGTPVKMNLSLFTARMNVCTGLMEGFIPGDYSVSVWMDSNDNQIREPNEELTEIATPKEDGRLCKLVERSTFIEDVSYEYSFTGPDDVVLGPADGSYNYKSEDIAGKFRTKGVNWIGVGFAGSTNMIEVKLTSPFTAGLTVEALDVDEHEGKTNCAATPPHACPYDLVSNENIEPTPVPGGPGIGEGDSIFKTLDFGYKYIPIITLVVGLLGVGLQIWLRRRRT
jgi:hypothetical protein